MPSTRSGRRRPSREWASSRSARLRRKAPWRHSGSPSPHSLLNPRLPSRNTRSASVRPSVGVAATAASASSTRPCHANAKERDVVRLHSRARTDRGGRQPVGQRSVCQEHGAFGGSDEQVGVGRKIGIDAQHRPPHHRSHLVGLVRRGQFGGDPTSQPAQPGRRRPAFGAARRTAGGRAELPAGRRRSPSVIRPRTSASSTAAGSVIRASDASSIGSPTASASTTSPTASGSVPIRDSINSARLGGTTGSPLHRQ